MMSYWLRIVSFWKIKMRLDEIDNSDRVFAAMVKIDLEIDKSYQSIGQLNILKYAKSADDQIMATED